jgi:hypothetical protein
VFWWWVDRLRSTEEKKRRMGKEQKDEKLGLTRGLKMIAGIPWVPKMLGFLK